jgi:hypothetical protein
VAGDTVVVRITFRGTDTGGYAGRSPTGRAVEEWVVITMHFEGDNVVREWIGADKLGLFIQLGVLDDPWPHEAATWNRCSGIAITLAHQVGQCGAVLAFRLCPTRRLNAER